MKDLAIDQEEDKDRVVFITAAEKRGVDPLLLSWVKEHGYHWVEFLPDWGDVDVEGAVVRYRDGEAYNAVAGFWRDEEMVEVCTHGVSFYDGVSTGTRDLIDRVADNGSPCATFMVTVEHSEDEHGQKPQGRGSGYSATY